MRVEESLPKHHEDHIAGKGDTIWYTNVFLWPQAMKIPAAKAAKDKEWEKLEKYSGVGKQKSETNQR